VLFSTWSRSKGAVRRMGGSESALPLSHPDEDERRQKQESAPKGAPCRDSEPTLKCPRALPTGPTRRRPSLRRTGTGVKRGHFARI
jgi:hypothetical protein